MIRFHWYGLEGEAKGRGCIVYSDASLADLLAWCRRNRVPLRWIALDESRMPHVDCWGKALHRLPPVAEGVDAATLRRHRRAWLARQAAREAGRRAEAARTEDAR